jgi:hypothetical protein
LNRFYSLTSGKRKIKKKQDLMVFKPSDALSLHKKHICLTRYIGGQKSNSSGVPIHAFAGVLPLATQALLVTLIELFLNYKPSAGRGEPGTWVSGQTSKSKSIRDWSKVILVGWMHPKYLKILHDYSHRWQWQEERREGCPLPLEFLLIWGHLDKRRNLC